MKQYNNITLEYEQSTALLTINRPQALNALNAETLLEIGEAVGEVGKQDKVQAMIITGAGAKAFVAGADIAYMQNLSAAEGRLFGILGQQVFRSIENLPLPVIAAVNGFALGGGLELAMACDFRIASENARFGQPEVSLGITPGFGGTQRLARLVGPGWAKQLIYTGDMIDVELALRIGLVNEVVPQDNLMKRAFELAAKIASRAPLAVRYAKAAINGGLECDIDRGCQIEADLFGLCFATSDQKEGMTAFIEKRKPGFKGM